MIRFEYLLKWSVAQPRTEIQERATLTKLRQRYRKTVDVSKYKEILS